MQINIRPAKSKDIQTIEKFQQKLVNCERPFDDGIPKEVIYYDINELYEDDDTILLVIETDKVIGCGFAQVRFNTERNEDYGYLGLMFVEEEYRGQGIAKKLLTNLTDHLKNKNIKDIRLKVYSENKQAIKAYEKFGFKSLFYEMQLK